MTTTIYITYDRYEHNEWFSIYNIQTDEQKAIENFGNALLDFLCYGPDDCHTFLLQKIDLPNSKYKKLLKLSKESGSEREFNDLMTEIYEDNESNWIFCTDGCSDVYDIVNYYVSQKGLDPDSDSEEVEMAKEEIYNDDELFTKMAKQYIEQNY